MCTLWMFIELSTLYMRWLWWQSQRVAILGFETLYILYLQQNATENIVNFFFLLLFCLEALSVFTIVEGIFYSQVFIAVESCRAN